MGREQAWFDPLAMGAAMSVENAICTHCGAGPLYMKKRVPTGTPLSPGLLPGLGAVTASVDVVACENCGFIQFFVTKIYRKVLAKSWKRIWPEADAPQEERSGSG
jgi:hypothetical protein